MEVLMNYLAKAEGIIVHRIKSEEDITSPYGIYRGANSSASIFKYIDEVAANLGITKDSKYWDQLEIDRVNTYMEKDKARKLATEFYINYFSKTPLMLLPDSVKITFFSVYTNSKRLGMKSLQNAIIDIDKTLGLFKKNNIAISIPDGYNGKKTMNSCKFISDQNDKMLNLYFETLITSNMKTEYAKLAVKKPNRFLHVLNGWMNRMDYLEQIK